MLSVDSGLSLLAVFRILALDPIPASGVQSAAPQLQNLTGTTGEAQFLDLLDGVANGRVVSMIVEAANQYVYYRPTRLASYIAA